MPVVGGLDIHRKQITFDYLGTVTGEVRRGRIVPAGREHLRAWLTRFAGCGEAAFAVEGCAGWRYVSEELAAWAVSWVFGAVGSPAPRSMNCVMPCSAAQETARATNRLLSGTVSMIGG